MDRARRSALKLWIEEKRRWDSPLPSEASKLGFVGWHARGYLPHYDVPNVTQFITFMLHDACPAYRFPERDMISLEGSPSEQRRKMEEWLDRCHGECWLRRPRVAGEIERILRAGDGQAYGLESWVIMPNHVHVVIDIWSTPMNQLVGGWKGSSARAANLLLGRRGRFWQEDYFDTLISGEEHLRRANRYVESNPVKARLVRQAEDWPWSSARFRDESGRLTIEGGVER